MKTYSNLEQNNHTSLALGYFDGVHIAHKKIIETLVKEAASLDEKTAVISFDKNPSDYFTEEQSLQLQTSRDKRFLLETLGLDYFYELNFEEYKDYSADEYLKLLIDTFNPQLIVVGEDHKFGKDKTGDVNFLKQHESEYNYTTIAIPTMTINGHKISSSTIREKIEKGDIESIKETLGRNYTITNSVIKGCGIAKKLGYPTANIIWPDNMSKLPYGAYLGFAKVENKTIPGMICWSEKKTIGNETEPTLEIHILGLEKDIYGKIISITFVKKLRSIMQFCNQRELIKQLNEDYKALQLWGKRYL